MTDQFTMQDPSKQYPQPTFEKQSQEGSGLARAMDPEPDHGEGTYRGTGRLTGRKAVITGADSGIGRAVAVAFAREGADVVLSYLPEEEPDAQDVLEVLADTGRRAIPVPGDIKDQAYCQRLITTAVKQLGGIDVLVDVAGKQQFVEDVADLTLEQFDETMKTNIYQYAMFWLCKAALEPPDKLAEFGSTSPMGRPGQPAELAPRRTCSSPLPSPATSTATPSSSPAACRRRRGRESWAQTEDPEGPMPSWGFSGSWWSG